MQTIDLTLWHLKHAYLDRLTALSRGELLQLCQRAGVTATGEPTIMLPHALWRAVGHLEAERLLDNYEAAQVSERLRAFGFTCKDLGGTSGGYQRMNGTAIESISDNQGGLPMRVSDPARAHIDAYGDPVSGELTTLGALLDRMEAYGGELTTNRITDVHMRVPMNPLYIGRALTHARLLMLGDVLELSGLEYDRFGQVIFEGSGVESAMRVSVKGGPR